MKSATRGEGDAIRYVYSPGIRWQSVLDGFDSIASIAAQRRIPVVLAIFPTGWRGVWEDYAYVDIHEQIRDAAEQRGFHVLDLLEPYSAATRTLQAVKLPEDGHPNVRGHELAAEALAPLIEARARQ
jgi:lysophospholipase L1-like esterase